MPIRLTSGDTLRTGHLDLAASASGSAGTTVCVPESPGPVMDASPFPDQDIDEEAQNSHLGYRSPLAFAGADGSFKLPRERARYRRGAASRKRLFRCGGFLNSQFLVHILDLAAQLKSAQLPVLY